MKFLIANDLHLGSKHATHSFDDVREIIYDRADKHTVFNGDIVDMSNCKRDDVNFWRDLLREIAEMVTRRGGAFVRGNHSLNQVEAPDFVVVDNVYFAHGDYVFWAKEKADAYRAKKPGAGFLKRCITPLYDELRQFADGGPNENFYKAMDKIIETYKPRAAVFGHRHCRENIIFKYKGVDCYILKRGIQEIEI